MLTRMSLRSCGLQAFSEQPYPQILTAWGRVYSLLRAALPAHCYHSGKQLASVRQDESQVRKESKRVTAITFYWFKS